jgi:hypothetical protein
MSATSNAFLSWTGSLNFLSSMSLMVLVVDLFLACLVETIEELAGLIKF